MPELNHPKENQVAAVGLLGIITSISRVLGFLREIVVAAVLGTSVFSDAFTLAFSIPDLFRRLFAEGALVNTFIPTFTEIKRTYSTERALAFAGNLITLFAVCLGLFCLGCILLAPVLVKYTLAIGYSGDILNNTVLLTQLMFGYIALITLASVYQGILNSFSVFWVSALTPVLLNLSVIGFALVLSPAFDNPAIAFALGVICGGMIQLLFHLPFIRQLGIRIKYGVNWKDPYLLKTLKTMAPAVFGLGVYQINIIIGNIIASTLAPGSVSSLKFSNRLLELIVGVFVISLTTVLLPRLSILFIEKKHREINEQLVVAAGVLAFFTIPIAAGGFYLSGEIVSLLFGRGEFDARSIYLTSNAFRFHIIALCFIAWSRLLLTCYQASGQIKKTVQAGIAIVVLNGVAAFILKSTLGHTGIALALSLSQVAHMILLVFFLRDLSIVRCGRIFLNGNLYRCLLSAALMILVIHLLNQALVTYYEISPLLHLSILVGVGGGVYLFISLLLGNAMLRQFIGLIRGG